MYLDCRGDQSTELQLGNAISGYIEQEIKAEIKIMKAEKEAEYKDISEAIKALKLEIQDIYTADTTIKSELETARAEALMEVGRMAEEVLKSNREAAHVAEQLKAAQAAHATTMSELETARAAEREALMEVGRMAEEVLKSNIEAAHVAEQLKAAQAAHATTMSELETVRGAEREAVTEIGTLTEEIKKCKREAEHVAEELEAVKAAAHAKLKELVDPSNKRMSFGSIIYNETYKNKQKKKKSTEMLGRFSVLWKKPQK